MILLQAAICASAGVFSDVQTRPMFSALDAGAKLPTTMTAAVIATNENCCMVSSSLRHWCGVNPCRFKPLTVAGTHAAAAVALTLPSALRWRRQNKNDRGNAHDLHPHSRRRTPAPHSAHHPEPS